ncbi:MAG: ribonuclease HI family protein, partial [Planctomycetota bacterium]
AKIQKSLPQKNAEQLHSAPFPENIMLYTDGASRGNPGPAGYGFLISDSAGKEIFSDCGSLGETTNNVAEYEALFYGLQACLTHRVKQVQIRADSELMIKQLNGQYRVKHPNLVPIFQKIQEQLKEIRWSAQHIRREQNKKADILANQGVDQGRTLFP